jgi:hypothetical protein
LRHVGHRKLRTLLAMTLDLRKSWMLLIEAWCARLNQTRN